MGLLFVAIYQFFGWQWLSLELAILVFGLVTVSFIDLKHRIIPDKLSLPGILVGLIGAAINPARSFWDSFWGVFLGGGVLIGIAYLYFAIKKRDGMGGGDIKLLAWIGSVLGWQSVLFVLFLSSVLGSLVGMLQMLRSGEGLKSSLAFGPFLAVAALVYMFWGTEVLDWYLNFAFPWLQPSM